MDHFNKTAGTDCASEENIKSGEGSVWTTEIITRVSTVFTVMIFTLIGNIFLITLILHKKSRRMKRVNIFIINLAIGDLAIAAITMTTEILFVAFGEWVLGPFMCKLSVYLQVVTLASATFLLTGMSVDRYQVIVCPMQSLASRPKIWRKVAIAWIMAFCFAVPQLAIFVHVEQRVENTTVIKRMCLSRGYSAPWQRKFYFLFLTLYTLLIPAIIMSFCYYKIAQVIWSRLGSQKNSISSTGGEMSVQRSLISRPKQRVVTMTLTVIIGFLSTLTPYFIVSLIRVFSDYTIQLKEALDISEIILMMHSAINPVLYGIFTFRWHHLKYLCNYGTTSERKRLRPSKTSDTTEEHGCLKLKCQIKFIKRRRGNFYDTSTIIANHMIREERENLARSLRHPSKRRNFDGFIGSKTNKSEKSVQVNESNFLRNSVYTDDTIDESSII